MVIYFLLLCLIFFLIIEIMTVMFKLTGLSEEKSRFQVISLLTSSGFTTKESELITQHPSRRKLAQYVMVIGYIGYLTGISFLINIIRTSLSFKNVLILLTFFIITLFMLKNKIFLKFLDNIIERILLKRPFKSPHKMYKLINRAKGYGVFNITLDEASPLINVSLMNSNLKPHNVIILNIDKGNKFIGFPKRDYVLEKGDNILLYGKVDEVNRIFKLKHKN
ncbi:TrkA-C domain-containing protein [Clostridium acidisoli DSM 12555]|uniref:TrkA-C domain-containing protein n=1 Tax=Clostridium acidisoli DSM 12555 TaxID=1121291 RepID=A0A1W1XGR8_9CLOT|nr:TrkA C-terminal domain-containing protein [Clostridium acidisoli]SMC22964.1 TrkA-C domain-containing protein [Clostridium acidisoli DSM 12555]